MNQVIIKIIVFSWAIGLAGCVNTGGHTLSEKEVCSKSSVDRLNPPQKGQFKDWVVWGKDFNKNVESVPNTVFRCYFPPRWPLATSVPSSDPVIIDAADLPAGAKEAPWVSMPGYIVYYTNKNDGSGYDYWAVKNDAKELADG